MTITYRGRDKNAVPRTGRIQVPTVEGFVSAAFERGWRTLHVRAEGRQVGEIHRDPEHKSKRTWWAES